MERIEELLLDNGLEGTSYFTGDDYDTAILGYTDEGTTRLFLRENDRVAHRK